MTAAGLEIALPGERVLGLVKDLVDGGYGPDHLAVVVIVAVEGLVTLAGLGLYGDGSCSGHDLQVAAEDLVAGGYVELTDPAGVLSLTGGSSSAEMLRGGS